MSLSAVIVIHIHTVFVGFDLNRRALRTVADARPRQHPQAVVCPLQQVVQHKIARRRVLYYNDRRLAVRPALGHVEDLVVGDEAVLLVLRRWAPRYAQRGGRLRKRTDRLGRCTGY